MTKWEYLIENFDSLSHEEEQDFNDLGNSGYELVTVCVKASQFVAIFKRQTE